MKTVTLRRAAKIRNRLESRIQDLARELRSTTISANIYDKNIVDQLSTSENEFRNTLARYMAASAALNELRIQIAKVNAKMGVNDLLTQRSTLQGQLARISTISGLTEGRLTSEQITARVAGLVERAKSGSAYSHVDDNIHLTFISKEMIADAEKTAHDLQIKLDEIQDELESINSTQTVELSEQELTVLQSEKIAI